MRHHHLQGKYIMEGNPAADALQAIIEMLASDISAEISEESASSSSVSRKMAEGTSLGSLTNLNQLDSDAAPVGQQDDEDRTLPLVMKRNPHQYWNWLSGKCQEQQEGES